MLIYILRRLLALAPVSLAVVTLVSALIHAVPGDPVDSILGPFATAMEKEQLRHELGLDQSFGAELVSYYAKIAKGDLGRSLINHRQVTALIAAALPPTLELAIIAMLVAIAIGVPLGIVSAIRAGHPIDYAAMVFALLGVAVPNFWLGPMLVLVFALHLRWLPVSERADWSSYILPAVTLGMAMAAMLSRMARNSMLDNLKEDYVRTARAKGQRETRVIGKHVLRNAALPLITVIGLQFGVLLTGAIITERVFDWPGLGSLILEGINNRDYPLVQGCVLVFSATYLIVNLCTDLTYALVDPRLRNPH